LWREVVFKPGRPKDQAPKPVNFTETLGPEYCGFPVLLEGSGKTNIIDLPTETSYSITPTFASP
jgi:hypothetical protein